MAKLDEESEIRVWSIMQQALKVVDASTDVEFTLFANFGETSETLPYLEEMKNVSLQAISTFSQLSILQLRIAEAQPIASTGILNMLAEAIAINQSRVPAWERSIEEVKLEWNFYG
ncbi:MAG: hypothetical protein WCO45_18220 [Pseudanabaena sp. ELA607]